MSPATASWYYTRMSDSEPRDEGVLFTRLGMEHTGDPAAPLRLRPHPALCHRGVVRPSVIALAVDMMAGYYAQVGAGTDWIFTTDLSLRAPARSIPECALVSGSLLRAGRSSVTSDVRLEVDGALYAYGQAGFIRVARRHGDPAQPDIHASPMRGAPRPLARPLHEEVGIAVTDAAGGRAEVELRDALRNPAGVMQGAIVALLAEVAAEALADASLGVPQVVTDLDIRYLAMARTGPMRAHASWVGPPGEGAISVLLRDAGNGDRITTSVLARTAAAPGGALESK